MQQKYYWIIGIVVVLAIIGIIVTYFPYQRTTSGALLAPCPGLYYLETSLNQDILNDQQAFDALIQFWTGYDPAEGVVIEDAIPSDITADEALQQGILRSGQTINLSGEGGVVDDVWMLYEHRAVDSEGNIYYCDFNVDVGPVPPPQEPGPAICGDGDCHPEENYETCPEDCPALPPSQ